MVELVDTRDLKSLDPKRSCGFESRSRHTEDATSAILKSFFMKISKSLTLFAASALLLTSCSKLGLLSADNFTVTPNPLETQTGVVPATINGQFPEKYMKKKAVVTVVPELRYANGQVVQGNTATFQGESVAGNDQIISYRVGGNYTLKTTFDYLDCNKAEMYLTFDARLGKKQVKIPAVKVADGIIATSELYKRTVLTADAAIAPDAYQRITKKKQEANIKFLIQQANLRKSELKNNSVQEFVRLLKQINDDHERLAIENVEVSAYASPDGQDWDGFQQLVGASDIQDKDIILRVLSMYKDPQEREQQIRNISQAFRELADGILPQLRRSRLTINYETIGRSDEQILSQFASDPSKLSIEEILYAATLKESADDKLKVYNTATRIYPNDQRAFNNIAAIGYAQGNDALLDGFNTARELPEAKANLGLLALKQGDISRAEQLIASATGANGLAEILGNLNLAKGNYAQAEQDFGDTYSNSAALAQILNKNYASADVTLRYIKQPDATTDYLRAILYARMGNVNDAAEALKSALAKDPSLAPYAARDIELAKVKQ